MFNLLKRRKKLKKIDTSKLPSRGLFYNDDFEIWIEKCDKDYIKEYKSQLDTTNLSKILKRITRVIVDHTSYSKGYSYRNIISIDLFFIFLEIVKYTNNKSIIIKHYDKDKGLEVGIELNEKTFDYFKTDKIIKSYNDKEKCFELNGYMLSPPTIGVEEDLTNFLNAISSIPGSEKYNDYNYNFLYVLGGETSMDIKKLKNLVQIFNNDITKEESEKLQDAVDKILPLLKYQLIYNNESVPISYKLDLSTIFG